MLVVIALCGVFVLPSQSAASFATYLLALGLMLATGRWSSVFRCTTGRLVAGLLGYLVLSSFWSDPYSHREMGSALSRGLLVFCFVVAVAEAVRDEAIPRGAESVLTVVGSGVAALSIGVFLWTAPEAGRLNGLGQLDTHVIAALVNGVVLIFALDLALNETARYRRVAAWLASAVLLLAIVLSGSRNAWLSAACGLLMLLIRSFPPSRRLLPLLGAAGLVMLTGVILAILLSDSVRVLLLPRGDSFRLEIWQTTLSRIAQSGPWFGLGILTPDLMMVDGFEIAHPHSMYLAVAYQGGAVGLGLLLLVAGRALWELLRLPGRLATVAASILAIALPSYLFDGHELIDKIGETWFLFWLPVGVALGLEWQRLPPARSASP